MQQKLFRVIDERGTQFYWSDKEFLNGYAKYVGWQGQCVYHALCRHEREGSCFPSLEHLSKELGIPYKAVIKGIKNLKELNIIKVEMRTKMKQGRGSNVYYLLKKESWLPVSNWSNQGKDYKPFKSIKVSAKNDTNQ